MTTSKLNLAHWIRHFEANAVRPHGVPWEKDSLLGEDERRTISKSIAIFQLGESSEGRNLLRFAQSYARRIGEPSLSRITQMFIREEQTHAALLARFMTAQGIPLVRGNWTDVVFRRLRKRAGYELSITVLIVAEIMALAYYPALKRRTRSPVLQAICDRLVQDERHHVRYQATMIQHIRSFHSAFRREATAHVHRLLFAGAVLAVWLDHRRIVGAFSAFWNGAWREFGAAFLRVGTHRRSSCARVCELTKRS